MEAGGEGERHPVPRRRHGCLRHAGRRRVAGEGTRIRRRRRAVAALRLRPARAALAGHPRRADPRLRSQRRLAPARHERRRRGRPPRALLERVRADRRHARVPEHHPARAEWRVRDREGRAGSDDHRQAQRQRAAPVGRRPVGHRARLRLAPAATGGAPADGPRDRQRSAGPLHPEHAPAHRSRPAVLRLPERQVCPRRSTRLPSRRR